MRRFGLIGRKLDHSFSLKFFSEYFAENRIDAEFINVEINEIDEVKQWLSKDFSGFCVTFPYKEQIIPLLSEISTEVQSIGAVNVLKRNGHHWIGHNSDAYGFQQSIKPFLTNRHERALIIGTGGAAKAVAYVLKEMGIDCIFLSRNPDSEKEFSYEQCNLHMINACMMVVNCTPVGTFPDTQNFPDIPYQFLTPEHFFVDLVYNPAETMFLKKAAAYGAMTMNGYSMLKEQALKAWEIWNS
jgi:shikimate dehydrogenase